MEPDYYFDYAELFADRPALSGRRGVGTGSGEPLPGRTGAEPPTKNCFEKIIVDPEAKV